MPKNVLPEAARVLPKAGQAIWMSAFNDALDRGLPEDEASMFAWAAVKRAGYSKNSGGKWSKDMDMRTEVVVNDDGSFVIGVPLVKINAEKRMVEGFATLDNLDQAGDIVDSAASKEAFADWVGNIREMHQKVAVGKAVDWRPDTYVDEETGKEYEGIWVTAKISKGAEDTWQKVLDGTLSGFSIGGATLEKQRELVKDDNGVTRQAWRITKYKLTELSLVDNPCNRLAGTSLVKSVDGVSEMTDVLDNGDIDKAYNGDTGEFEDLSEEYRGVVRALENLRDRAIAVNADEVVSEASEQLSCYRRKARWEASDAEYASSVAKSEDSKEGTTVSEKVEKSEETLQVNENSGTNSVELTEEDKGLFRKFVDFIKGEEAPGEATEEAIEKEGTEMNAEEIAKVVDSKAEELAKDVDGKFEQVGESLTKIADLLEKVATSESVDELKKDFEAKFEELAGRVDAVEKSGAVKKSGEEAGEAGEKIEKSEDGFWGGNILPEFVKG